MSERAPLEEQAKAIKAMLRDADVGPLRAAKHIVALLDGWEQYRDEAGGAEPEAWASEAFGTRAAAPYFRRRAEAVDLVVSLGFSRSFVESRFQHDALVYLTGCTIKNEHRKDAIDAVVAEQKRRKSLVSENIARRVVWRTVGRHGRRPLQEALSHIAAMYAAAKEGKPLPPMPPGLGA